MSGARAFVDTNVLAYALDAADPDKQARAQHVLTSHGAALAVSTQVMLELFAVCTRKLGMNAVDAATAARAASRMDVVPADRSLMLDAVALATSQSISVFDAAIVCAALRAECELLLSEDLALPDSVDGITVVNPFA